MLACGRTPATIKMRFQNLLYMRRRASNSPIYLQSASRITHPILHTHTVQCAPLRAPAPLRAACALAYAWPVPRCCRSYAPGSRPVVLPLAAAELFAVCCLCCSCCARPCVPARCLLPVALYLYLCACCYVLRAARCVVIVPVLCAVCVWLCGGAHTQTHTHTDRTYWHTYT
jgi:hypothetical protein